MEMISPHAHSDGSHGFVVKQLRDLGYHCYITDRVPASFCGDFTDKNRWFLLAFLDDGPDFDLLDYCGDDFTPATHALDPIDSVDPQLWINEPAVFRTHGGDDLPWGSDYPKDPRVTGQYVTRATIVAYVNGVRRKENKAYDVDTSPVPTITRNGLIIRDTRDTSRPDHLTLRYCSMGECAKFHSFFGGQIAHLRSIPFTKAMTQIAGSVPVAMLHTVYTCAIEQFMLRRQLSNDSELSHLCSLIPETGMPTMSTTPQFASVFHTDLPVIDDAPGFLPDSVFRHKVDLDTMALYDLADDQFLNDSLLALSQLPLMSLL